MKPKGLKAPTPEWGGCGVERKWGGGILSPLVDGTTGLGTRGWTSLDWAAGTSSDVSPSTSIKALGDSLAEALGVSAVVDRFKPLKRLERELPGLAVLFLLHDLSGTGMEFNLDQKWNLI